MATSYKDIRDAIKSRIAALWTTTPIHWTNTTLNPGSAAWIQPRTLFHGATQVSLGPQGHKRIVGDVHVNIFTPAGAGDDEVMMRTDAFIAIFTPANAVGGLLLPTATRTITFEVPVAQDAIEDEDGYQVPVFCPFYFDEKP